MRRWKGQADAAIKGLAANRRDDSLSRFRTILAHAAAPSEVANCWWAPQVKTTRAEGTCSVSALEKSKFSVGHRTDRCTQPR